MPDRSSHIDTLVRSLTDLQRDMDVDSLLDVALKEPLSAEAQLRQVQRVLEAVLVLFGKDDAQDLDLLLNLGRAYERFAHLEKAYETYETALPLAEQLG